MEEYDRNAPIRPRGIYTGPAFAARAADAARAAAGNQTGRAALTLA